MTEIVWDVPYIRQSGKMDCWAAAAAMVLGKSVGKGFAERKGDGGLRITEENLGLFAISHGLRMLPEQSQSNTIDKIAALLRDGPIFAGGKFTRRGGHAYVIAGVRDDKVLVLDPSSRGGKGWINYSTLMTSFPYATAIMMQKEKPSLRAATPGIVQSGASLLLRRGSHDPEVVDLQKRLGLKPDGIFGPQTHGAVMDFQRRNGLRVDGIVGPQTRGCFNNPLQMAL